MDKEQVQKMLEEGRVLCPDCGEVLEYLALVNMDDSTTINLPENGGTYCFECEKYDVGGVDPESYERQEEMTRGDLAYDRYKEEGLC